MEALNSTTDNLIETTYRSNQYDIEKTNEFLKEASDTVEVAIRMGFMCNAFAGDEVMAKQRIVFNEEVQEQMPILVSQTLEYLNWVKNISDFIDAEASKIKFDDKKATQELVDSLVKMLRDMFLVGDWFISAFQESEYNELCFKPSAFYLIRNYKYENSYWRVLAVLSPKGQSHDVEAAKQALDKIEGIGFFDSCLDYAKGMMKDAGYTCGSDQFTFFGAIGDPITGVSDANLLSSKRLSTGAFGSCKYWIGILS